jgi:hypothetical protein
MQLQTCNARASRDGSVGSAGFVWRADVGRELWQGAVEFNSEHDFWTRGGPAVSGNDLRDSRDAPNNIQTFCN